MQIFDESIPIDSKISAFAEFPRHLEVAHGSRLDAM
jgi:hypothetical protein